MWLKSLEYFNKALVWIPVDVALHKVNHVHACFCVTLVLHVDVYAVGDWPYSQQYTLSLLSLDICGSLWLAVRI